MSLDRVPGDANLYISGIFTLRRRELLKAANITHIVSALRLPLDQELFEGYEHYVVDVDDTEEENLLRWFPGVGEFVRGGLEGGGGVLVHCAMGKSRSTTLLIAYLLSTTHPPPANTPETLLALIRESRPFAEPNPGFMRQLALYHAMHAPTTPAALAAHPLYQEWLFQRAVEDSNARGVAPEVAEIKFADAAAAKGAAAQIIQADDVPPPLVANADAKKEEPENASAMDLDTPPQPPPLPTPPTPSLTYRCRRCRHPLATSSHVLDHAAGATINFAARSNPLTALRTFTTTTPAERCAHLFIEPLSWMRPELEKGEVEGRLMCPNKRCGGVVGRYAWQGLRCSCGAWVVPGVALGWGRIDESREAGGRGSGRM